MAQNTARSSRPTPGRWSPEDAIRLVGEQNVRRIPIVEDGRPAGVVTIGDLAIERDPASVLADISSEPANN